MTTECADTLITDADRLRSEKTNGPSAHWHAVATALGAALNATFRALLQRRTARAPVSTPAGIPGRRRYESFETRSDDLGDLLRGGIFPRIPGSRD